MVTGIETTFPGLVGKEYLITSPEDDAYNCIAWAVGIASDWWWPDGEGKGRWPTNVPREESVATFFAAFATLGFGSCSSHESEAGFEKIALFANTLGLPKHAARQLSTGRWSSKLGRMHDIEHDLLDLEGTAYGSVVMIMKRPLPISA